MGPNPRHGRWPGLRQARGLRGPVPLLSLSLCLAASCGRRGDPPGAGPAPDTDDPGEPDDTDTSGEDCEDAGTWRTVGLPFTATYCAGCHSSWLTGEARRGAPEGVDLDTLEGAITHLDPSAARVAEGTMPPGAGPGQAEVTRFLRWL